MKEEGLPQWNPEEDVGYRSIDRVINGNCEWQKLKYHSKKMAIFIFCKQLDTGRQACSSYCLICSLLWG